MKDLAVRAWEHRPDWRDNTLLLATGALLVWLLGIPWWVLPISYGIAVPAFCLLLARLELGNEAANREKAPGPEATDQAGDG